MTTAQRWISVLEASYIIFLLQPHFKNFNKRLTKAPKLYFYDTGLACALLGIETPKNLATNALYGHCFENFIVADLFKQYFNIGMRPPLYFWRDMNGRIEVDCLIEQNTELFPIEIKSGETVAANFFSGLSRWTQLAQAPDDAPRYVVYGGKGMQQRTAGTLVGWREMGQLVDMFRK